VQEVPPCEGLIQDHVRSTVASTNTNTWLVDGFGAAHAVGPKSLIGRNHEGQIVVLAASVSREHAELRHTDAGWHIRDLGSRNGTFVDGTRGQGRVTLPARAVIKVGDVAMWFLADVVEEPSAPPTMETASPGGALVRYVIQHTGSELCVLGPNDCVSGGSLLSRVNGSDGWGAQRELPPLEFQLLRALCARANEEAGSPAAVRGCITTKQLAKDLPFKSKWPNEENVRQVVRRLRGALAEVGTDGILAAEPGRGYYLVCPVTATRSN
jgi:hypothetical protein